MGSEVPDRGKQSSGVRVFRLVGSLNQDTGEYHLYMTNIPADRLDAEDIARVYRARWEVELIFNELKSHYDLSGTCSWSLPGQEAFQANANGLAVPSGWRVENQGESLPDGTWVVSRANGDLYGTRTWLSLRRDLSVESFCPASGARTTLYGDGTRWSVAPGGLECAIRSDGVALSVSPHLSGVTLGVAPDGTRTLQCANGLRVETSGDNSERWVRSDGVCVTVSPGPHVDRYVTGVFGADGTPLDWQALRHYELDGRIRLSLPDGTTEYLLPDLSLLRVSPNGLQRLTRADGSQVWCSRRR